jgi:hypothetical protein
MSFVSEADALVYPSGSGRRRGTGWYRSLLTTRPLFSTAGKTYHRLRVSTGPLKPRLDSVLLVAELRIARRQIKRVADFPAHDLDFIYSLFSIVNIGVVFRIVNINANFHILTRTQD